MQEAYAYTRRNTSHAPRPMRQPAAPGGLQHVSLGIVLAVGLGLDEIPEPKD